MAEAEAAMTSTAPIDCLSREELVQKVFELQQGLSALAIKELVTHHEEVREREQAVGQREARLAEREAALALREAALAAREANEHYNTSIAVSSIKSEHAECATPVSLKALMTPTPARSSMPVPQGGQASGLAGRLAGCPPAPPMPAGSSQVSSPCKEECRRREEEQRRAEQERAQTTAWAGSQLPPQAARPLARQSSPAQFHADSKERRIAPMLESRAVTFVELRAELMGREQISDMQVRGYWQTLQAAEYQPPPSPPATAAPAAAACATPQRRRSGPGEGSASKLKAMFEGRGTPAHGSAAAAGSATLPGLGGGRGARRTAPATVAMVMQLSNLSSTPHQTKPKVSLADLLAADQVASRECMKPSAAEAAAARFAGAGEPPALYSPRESHPIAAPLCDQSCDRVPRASSVTSSEPQALGPAPRVSLAALLRKEEEGKLRALGVV